MFNFFGCVKHNRFSFSPCSVLRLDPGMIKLSIFFVGWAERLNPSIACLPFRLQAISSLPTQTRANPNICKPSNRAVERVPRSGKIVFAMNNNKYEFNKNHCGRQLYTHVCGLCHLVDQIIVRISFGCRSDRREESPVPYIEFTICSLG